MVDDATAHVMAVIYIQYYVGLLRSLVECVYTYIHEVAVT